MTGESISVGPGDILVARIRRSVVNVDDRLGSGPEDDPSDHVSDLGLPSDDHFDSDHGDFYRVQHRANHLDLGAWVLGTSGPGECSWEDRLNP